MSIFLVSLMGAPLFLAPLWTHLRFQEAFLLEKAIIATDNASIRLGQSFRDALQILQRGRSEILTLEKLHHVSHACAVAPVPFSPLCKAEDTRIEVQIQARRAAIVLQAQAAWSKGTLLALQEGTKLQTSVRWKRPERLPVHSRLCHVCLQPAEWAPVLPWGAQVFSEVGGRKTTNRVEAIISQNSPSYQVYSEPENE